jgi:hypothetical protein
MGGGESANDVGRAGVFFANLQGNGLLLFDPNPSGVRLSFHSCTTWMGYVAFFLFLASGEGMADRR